MKVFKWTLLFVMTALLTAGCEDVSRQGETAGETVNKVLARRATLSSMQATGTMRITDPVNQFFLGVNIDVVAQKPAQLRIVADKLGGRIQAFDIVVVDDDILFYIPRKKVLFQGKLSELTQSKRNISIEPSEILSHLLQDTEILAGRAWKKVESPSGVASIVGESLRFLRMQKTIWFEEIHNEGEGFFRMLVDTKTNDLLTLQKIDSKGELMYEESYSLYESVRQGKVFPYKMLLSWPSEQKTIAVRIKKLKVNRRIDPSKFALEVDENVRTKSILDAKIEGDKESADKVEAEQIGKAGDEKPAQDVSTKPLSAAHE